MNELGVMPTRKHLKCAKIVGETMGNYHPHGDQAIYPTLVHMAQPWAMRERLVDSQGNFGSVEGDPPASMRYTEARLTHLGAVLMEDMEKDTVDFVPNYDETRTEPTVFPAAFPNLLVNGGTGIAVGMATNMPPHNLGEVIDGICAQIDKPSITIPELMKFIKGPDFPTGGVICGVEGIKNYFTTGKGSVKLRGRVGVEELKGNREQLIVTEIPFNVNRAESGRADRRTRQRKDHHRHFRDAQRVGRALPARDRTQARGHSESRHRESVSSTRNWKFRSASTRWRLIMAGRKRSISRKLSSATSSIAAKSFCAARGLNCARPRNAPNCSKATSSRCQTSTNSSPSSAVPKRATRPR